ncbi:uncharacterized protein [Dermacentor andersoni]|uniref:uncharacterized protein isoform X1 n=1 Tax=Dermacentor andersoni TaxID=34620 RepID=UPI002417CCDB|nr:uncharacterized protein LOC126540229 isoform X1 [Dermacentor andersoni]
MEHRDFPMPERRRFGSTDIMVPELSFGASGLGLVKEGSAEEEEAVAAVRNALRCGVNYFDTAPWYGQGRSEEVLGKALQGLSRDAFYAATKVGRYEPECDRMFDFSGSRTLESVRESLEKMKLTYFDVVQVHDVEFAPSVDVIVNETLPALESLRCAGIIRYIGITGYPLHVLREVLQKSSIRVDTVLSYCRGTLFDDSLADYLPFFQSMGLGVANAAPLGMGLLTSSPPPAWHPAAEDLKKACAEAAQFCKYRSAAQKYFLLEHGPQGRREHRPRPQGKVLSEANEQPLGRRGGRQDPAETSPAPLPACSAGTLPLGRVNPRPRRREGHALEQRLEKKPSSPVNHVTSGRVLGLVVRGICALLAAIALAYVV